MAIFYEFLMYFVTSIAGYISFLDNTPELVINRDEIGTGTDYPMLVGRMGTVMLMLTSITIMGAPCRKQIMTFLKVKGNSKG